MWSAWGESKTPSPFVKACDRFKTLDILMRSVEEIPKKGRNVGKSYSKRENNNIAEQSTEKKKMRQIFRRSPILERSKRQSFHC